MDRLSARRVCRDLGVFLALVPFFAGSSAAQETRVAPAVQGVPPPPSMTQGQPPRDRVRPAQRVGTAAIRAGWLTA